MQTADLAGKGSEAVDQSQEARRQCKDDVSRGATPAQKRGEGQQSSMQRHLPAQHLRLWLRLGLRLWFRLSVGCFCCWKV